jgi:hypothetical protein
MQLNVCRCESKESCLELELVDGGEDVPPTTYSYLECPRLTHSPSIPSRDSHQRDTIDRSIGIERLN